MSGGEAEGFDRITLVVTAHDAETRRELWAWQLPAGTYVPVEEEIFARERDGALRVYRVVSRVVLFAEFSEGMVQSFDLDVCEVTPE